jgi:two-component system alkaline phosphatase synthesis response regulator PhoP
MSKKILVVENEELISKAYLVYLSQLGYDVKCAFDGESGLQCAVEFKPHLILSDINMPKMDGIEMLRAIRNISEIASVPVIMLTSVRTSESAYEALSLGSTHYLVKVDYDLEEIAKKIADILNK